MKQNILFQMLGIVHINSIHDIISKSDDSFVHKSQILVT